MVGIDSKTTDETEEVAKSFGAETYPFDLDDNFAAARDLSFSKAPDDTEWFFWIDSDDVLGSDITVKKLAEEQPEEVTMVWLPYAYHRDEYGNVTTMFDRERLIRKTAKPKWIGRLHETCAAERMVNARDKRVWIEHTNRTDDGKGERNFRILRKMVASDANDHRAVLYLAHQYFAANQWADACEWYEKFISLASPGDVLEEKWQALIYLAKARRSAGDITGSIRAAKEALMMCPKYADSYFELAHGYAIKGDFTRAIHWHEEGLTRDQPDNILILNPLDYSFNPFVVAHQCYYKQNKLDKAYEAVQTALGLRPRDPSLVNSLYQYKWAIGRKSAVDDALGTVEFLLLCNEPLKARDVLKNLPAGTTSDAIELMNRKVEDRLKHLANETEYENFYFDEQDTTDVEDAIDANFPRVDWVISRLKAMGAKKVLEVGVGDGVPAFRYAKAGFQVVGIDVDPRRVQKANRAAVRFGYLKSEARDDLDGLIANNAKRLEDYRGTLAINLKREEGFTEEARKATEDTIAGLEARDKALKTEKDTAKIVITDDAQLQFWWSPAEEYTKKVKELGPFDAIILGELIEHVADIDKVLDQAGANGKHVLITTPDGASSYQYFQNHLYPDGNHSGHVRALALQDVDALMWKRGRIIESHILHDTEYILVGEYKVGDSTLENPPVVIYCGPGLEEWSPEQIDREGLGGSETAVVKLAEELVRKGLRVMVYGPSEGVWNGVYYRKHTKFNPTNPVFLFISWRNPALFDLPINARVKYLWMHDTDAGDRLTEQLAQKIDGVMALSKWHVSHLEKTYPFLKDKCFIVGNGIDPVRFEPLPPLEAAGDQIVTPSPHTLRDYFDARRQPNRFAYVSSPDRGLEQALLNWKSIRKAIPDAELHVFYGWENYDRMHQPREFKQHVMKLADQSGVVWRGRVGQKQLAKELMKCSALYYPGPHPFEETFCIGALEAQAAGAAPVTRDNGALPETNQHGFLLSNSGSSVQGHIKSLRRAANLTETQRQEMIAWAKTRTWGVVADALLAKTRETFRTSEVGTGVAA